MKIEQIKDGLHLITFDTQYALTSTMLRLQEFYESPFPQCRGKYFTLEDYMDLYAASRGHKNFTYFTDWSGFNVPCRVVKNFLVTYKKKLTKKEDAFFEYIEENVNFREPFYIIATYEGAKGSVRDHEIAHGMFYLDEEYNTKANLLVEKLTKAERKVFCDFLAKQGYDESVFDDEINAYAATSSMVHLAGWLETKNLPWGKIFEMQELFAAYKHSD